MWHDGEQIRQIRSKSIRETWTQYDPELVEREYLPKERRKELRTVKVSRPPAAVTAVAAPRPPEPPRTEAAEAASVVAVGR